jgi:hypothetical protein
MRRLIRGRHGLILCWEKKELLLGNAWERKSRRNGKERRKKAI